MIILLYILVALSIGLLVFLIRMIYLYKGMKKERNQWTAMYLAQKMKNDRYNQ